MAEVTDEDRKAATVWAAVFFRDESEALIAKTGFECGHAIQRAQVAEFRKCKTMAEVTLDLASDATAEDIGRAISEWRERADKAETSLADLSHLLGDVAYQISDDCLCGHPAKGCDTSAASCVGQLIRDRHDEWPDYTKDAETKHLAQTTNARLRAERDTERERAEKAEAQLDEFRLQSRLIEGVSAAELVSQLRSELVKERLRVSALDTALEQRIAEAGRLQNIADDLVGKLSALARCEHDWQDDRHKDGGGIICRRCGIIPGGEYRNKIALQLDGLRDSGGADGE